MSKFAEHTSVPIDRSRAEVERLIQRYGCSRFGVMNEADGSAMVYFEHQGRQLQIPVKMPPKAKYRVEKEWDQERRRRWRVLVLTLKAMLEAVASKLLTFDQAFLAHIVIPGTSKTLGDTILPKLDALYSGQLALPPAFLSET